MNTKNSQEKNKNSYDISFKNFPKVSNQEDFPSFKKVKGRHPSKTYIFKKDPLQNQSTPSAMICLNGELFPLNLPKQKDLKRYNHKKWRKDVCQF